MMFVESVGCLHSSLRSDVSFVEIDFVYSFFELVDILILSFSHSLVPVVGLAFDLLSYG